MERLYWGRLHVKVVCLWSSLECPGSQAPLTRTRPPQAFAHLHTHKHTSLWAPHSPRDEMSTPSPLLKLLPKQPWISNSLTNLSTQTGPTARGRHFRDQGLRVVEDMRVYASVCKCARACICACVSVFLHVCICVEGGVYPQTQVAQFFGKSLAHPRGKSRRRRWWRGRGPRPWGNKALFQTCRKQGSLCCDAGAPSYVGRCYRKDAISTSV